jgi:hypothetical protein
MAWDIRDYSMRKLTNSSWRATLYRGSQLQSELYWANNDFYRWRKHQEMRRAILIVALLLLPIILIVLILSVQSSDQQTWEVELDNYKLYKEAVISSTLKTKLIDRGTMPWHFSSIMSKAAFGENPHFGTDYGYDGRINEGGSTSLPYPPEAVWCALLAADAQSPDSSYSDPYYLVVFIAEHKDLSNSAFVVHEIASDHIPLVESLSLVGCKTVKEEIQLSEAGRWT